MTIEAFSARLRQQVDPDTITAELPAGGDRQDHAADPDAAMASASSRNDAGTAARYNHAAGNGADRSPTGGER